MQVRAHHLPAVCFCNTLSMYLHCGHFEEHNYLVMELLGMNLSELRRRLPSTRPTFSPATTVRLVVQMIQCVAALHNGSSAS